MKFQIKYPDAGLTERYEFQYSYVTKTPALAPCRWCGSMTRWLDVIFQMPVCSEECGDAMWRKYRDDQIAESKYANFEDHFGHVKEDLKLAERCDSNLSKDILVVVHDQLPYLKECVETIAATTKNYHLYIWDNASEQETIDYMQSLERNGVAGGTVHIHYNSINAGFNPPNNAMASWGNSDYIILLNSDCKVFEYWDRAMIGFLREHPEVAEVGYWGGHLSADGRGFGGSNGWQIDYVPGWCFTISRDTYRQFGLFSTELVFAYCEDADFSLRLKEAGKKIYALHAPLVHHYQNKTIKAVEKKGDIDVRATFERNHEYIRRRWKDYLEHGRVLLEKA